MRFKTAFLAFAYIQAICNAICNAKAYTLGPAPINSNLSYSDQFVDQLNSSLQKLRRTARPAMPETYQCSILKIYPYVYKRNSAKKSTEYNKLMKSQFLKNSIAIAAYKTYISPSNSPHLKSYMEYMVGICGYWEIAAARSNDLLQSVNSVSDYWRKGIPIEAGSGQKQIKDYAAITSTMGDLILGIESATQSSKHGEQASFNWGQLQEGIAEKSIRDGCSGTYLESKLDPAAPWSYSDFKLHLIPQFIWMDFTIDFLNYNSSSYSAYKITQRGKKYLKQFSTPNSEAISMLDIAYNLSNLAYKRISNPNPILSKLYYLLYTNISNNSNLNNLLLAIQKIILAKQELTRQFELSDKIIPKIKTNQNRITKKAIDLHNDIIKNLQNMRITPNTLSKYCNIFPEYSRTNASSELHCNANN